MFQTKTFISLLTIAALLTLSWVATLAADEPGKYPIAPGVAQDEPTEEPTTEPTPEPKHPVAWKIAVYFGSGDLTPPTPEPTAEPTAELPTAEELYEEIMELHSEGVGFGVIAQAFFIVKNLKDKLTEEEMATLAEKLGCGSTCTAFDLIRAKQEGIMTWGEIKKMGGNPGNKGENLGKIMSGRGNDEEITAEGQAGKDKPGKSPPGRDKSQKPEHGKGKGGGKKK